MLTCKTVIPGISVAVIIVSVISAALFSLCQFAIESGNLTVYFDRYLLHIVTVTLLQAALSTWLCVICALLMAKALSMVDFMGKRMLLRIMPVTFILPSLVVISGLLYVYGQQGLFARIANAFGIDVSLSIYGLKGILLAHLFLNFPYACRLFYQSLMSVPIEQKQLAVQLNFSAFTFFRLVEWPYLRRQLLPMAALIFMLCFSSFAIVLALGGGPKYTTIEVAIYQAVRDFDLLQAVVLSGIQLIFCLCLIGLSRKVGLVSQLNTTYSSRDYRMPCRQWIKGICGGIVVLGGFFIFAPMVFIVIEGMRYFNLAAFSQPFWVATGYSVMIALGSASITLLFACLLLWTNSRLLIERARRFSHRLMLIGSFIFAVPSMVLASGLFLLFFDYSDNAPFVCLLIIMCNSLLALPFVLKNLEFPMYDIAKRYHSLSQSLNITGIAHFYLIEYRALKPVMITTFAFACLLSLGDFGIIALFGGQSVSTLPYYLYEQIANYRYQDAAVTALVLFILSLGLLMVMDNDRT